MWRRAKKNRNTPGKKSEDNIIKYVRNLIQDLKENEAIKEKIIKHIKTLFKSEKEIRKLLRTSKGQ